MKLVIIIFVIIILISFITGIILSIRENKKTNLGSLTDDPRILFSVDEDKAVIIPTLSKEVNTTSNVNVSEEKVSVLDVSGENNVSLKNDSEGFSLPSSSEYGLNKFVFQGNVQEKNVPSNLVQTPASDSSIVPELQEETLKEKVSDSRFIAFDEGNEEII